MSRRRRHYRDDDLFHRDYDYHRGRYSDDRDYYDRHHDRGYDREYDRGGGYPNRHRDIHASLDRHTKQF